MFAVHLIACRGKARSSEFRILEQQPEARDACSRGGGGEGGRGGRRGRGGGGVGGGEGGRGGGGGGEGGALELYGFEVLGFGDLVF